MEISETAAEPVNPLVGNLTTISMTFHKEPYEAQGLVVKPGLAITPAYENRTRKNRFRYNLTHVPTGLAVRLDMCGTHIQEIAARAVGYPIDWALGKDEVIAAIKATDFLEKTTRRQCGGSFCDGDGPPPPTYGVCCDTCGWEWEDEYDEGPLTLEDAKRQARGHECEPYTRIMSPVTGKWHVEWALAEAEKKATPDWAATDTRPNAIEKD